MVISKAASRARRTDGRTDGRADGRTNARMDGQIAERTYGQMDERTDRPRNIESVLSSCDGASKKIFVFIFYASVTI